MTTNIGVDSNQTFGKKPLKLPTNQFLVSKFHMRSHHQRLNRRVFSPFLFENISLAESERFCAGDMNCWISGEMTGTLFAHQRLLISKFA
jgi:hypothetical protein